MHRFKVQISLVMASQSSRSNKHLVFLLFYAVLSSTIEYLIDDIMQCVCVSLCVLAPVRFGVRACMSVCGCE